MKKLLLPALFLILAIFSCFYFVKPIFSDELDDVTKQLGDLKTKLDMSVKATTPLQSELDSDKKQITNIKYQVSTITRDISAKKKSIDASYVDLAKKEELINATIRDLYMKSYSHSPLLTILSVNNAVELTRVLAYQKAAQDEDKNIITNIALEIQGLELKKQELESAQTKLVAIKVSLDAESAQLDKVIQGAKAYQTSLNSQIAALSAKQQDLVAAKQASLHLPTSAYTTSGGCSSDLTNGKDPGFSPKFGLFTFGVPHRAGMSQYGAKGRAEAGQNATDILNAYFQTIQFSTVSTSTNIHVTGANEYGQTFDDNWDIETYLTHLYEIPSAWPIESLKAQAIAARSYALAVTNNGANTICPSQSCQVVKKELNADSWVQAVHATAGQIMTNGGTPVKAFFSSTAGGYIHSTSDIGWSNTPYTKNALDASGTVNSFDDLKNNAYDKNSPWFYCDWGSRSQYSGTAWLKPEELADIINVILLAKADNGTTSHLSQSDTPNPDGTDTWDANRVQQELRNRGINPYHSVSSASVDWDKANGKTTNITISGDAGSQTFNGTDFKSFFNVRAPANIQIVGPLYNIEIK